MNGFVSGMRMFYAGVRQGCPLSPLLYLFVGEALLRYLQSKGIHITIHGIQLSATQFADDTQVYLESPAQVAQFLTHMQVMAAASGQKLNLHKSKLLLLGAAARQQHSALLQQHASGALALSPVLQANVLGICVGSDAPVDWEQQVANVEAALTRLSHIPRLSIFGRGMGSAAYGVSTFLYAAEFSDLPTDIHRQQLTASVAKLVDRGLAPASHVRRFTGVAARLLAGRPAEGGFGTLPWLEHIRARHAWWGALFVQRHLTQSCHGSALRVHLCVPSASGGVLSPCLTASQIPKRQWSCPILVMFSSTSLHPQFGA